MERGLAQPAHDAGHRQPATSEAALENERYIRDSPESTAPDVDRLGGGIDGHLPRIAPPISGTCLA